MAGAPALVKTYVTVAKLFDETCRANPAGPVAMELSRADHADTRRRAW
jgi:hypothetical protein